MLYCRGCCGTRSRAKRYVGRSTELVAVAVDCIVDLGSCTSEGDKDHDRLHDQYLVPWRRGIPPKRPVSALVSKKLWSQGADLILQGRRCTGHQAEGYHGRPAELVASRADCAADLGGRACKGDWHHSDSYGVAV